MQNLFFCRTQIRSFYYKYIASEESVIRDLICNSQTYKYYRKYGKENKCPGFLYECCAMDFLADHPKRFKLKHLAHACDKRPPSDTGLSRITVNTGGYIDDEHHLTNNPRLSNDELLSIGRCCLRCAVEGRFTIGDMGRLFGLVDIPVEMFASCIVQGKLALELTEKRPCNAACGNHLKML